MSAILDLVLCVGNEVDILLKLLNSSARTKIVQGMPLTVQTNNSEEKKTTKIGFVIYNITSSKLIHCRYVNFGFTLNEVQLYAIL